MSFRLWTIFYVFTLLAAAMATFGPWGIAGATAVIIFWGAIYSAQRPITLGKWVVIVGVVVVIIALLLPALDAARESSRLGACRNNLKQLSIALLDYESRHGSFPSASIEDGHGTPMHSWRTLILSNIERMDLSEQIDRTQSWDAPANRTATSADVDQYQCPPIGNQHRTQATLRLSVRTPLGLRGSAAH